MATSATFSVALNFQVGIQFGTVLNFECQFLRRGPTPGIERVFGYSLQRDKRRTWRQVTTEESLSSPSKARKPMLLPGLLD